MTRILGKSRKLLHSSFWVLKLISRTVDAAKAVFGDDAPVAPDVLEVQPLRINQVTKTLNRALPQDVREQIFEQDACEHHLPRSIESRLIDNRYRRFRSL